MPLTIAFHTSPDPWPWLRQTPGGTGVWGNCRFLVNPTANSPADWLVVYDSLPAPLRTTVPLQRRMCVLGEPPEMKTYAPAFLRQFGHLLSPYAVAGYRGQHHRSHSGLPWHFGVDRRTETATFPTLETLAALPCPADKAPRVAVVCSDKTISAAHRQRLAFLAQLKQALGDRVAHFGRGFTQIHDKADATLPYQFHLVLENNALPQFWTEKLADAYLGWAFPFFSGGAGLKTDFPPEAFLAIDIHQPEAAITSIARVLDTPGFFTSRLPALAAARQRVLETHNLFALLSRIVSAAMAEAAHVPPAAALPRPATLWPARLSSPRRRLRWQVQAALRGRGRNRA